MTFIISQRLIGEPVELFRGDEIEVYVYLRKWNFPEASMIWVIDSETALLTSTLVWFQTRRRKMIEGLVKKAALFEPDCSCYPIEGEALEKFTQEITEEILNVI